MAKVQPPDKVEPERELPVAAAPEVEVVAPEVEAAAPEVKVVAAAVTGETVEYPTVKLRYAQSMLLVAAADHPIEVVLESQRLGTYESPLRWEIYDPDDTRVASGVIPHAKRGTIAFVRPQDGVYMLKASSGLNPYCVISSNVPLGILAEGGLPIIHGADRLYFRVPPGVRRFTVSFECEGPETACVGVVDPDGNLVDVGETSLQQTKGTIEVQVGVYAGQTWSLGVIEAAEGILEDSLIKLDPKLPPVFWLAPEHVFETE